MKSVSQLIAGYINALPLAVKLLFIPLVVMGAFYLLWLYLRLRYRTWLKKTLKADCSSGLKRVFMRTVLLLKNLKVEMKRFETPNSYAARVLGEQKIDITGLAEAFNNTAYGDIPVSSEELRKYLEQYQKAASQVRALVRRPKAWFIR